MRAFALFFPAVDYILFLTADVDVTPNLNEIRDYKYVDKAELQAMFEDPCEPPYFPPRRRARADGSDRF